MAAVISAQQPTTFLTPEKDITVVDWKQDLTTQFTRTLKRPSISITVKPHPHPNASVSDSASSINSEPVVSYASSTTPIPAEPEVIASTFAAPRRAPQPHAAPRPKLSSKAYLKGMMHGLASAHAAPQTHGLADVDRVSRPAAPVRAVAPRSQSRFVRGLKRSLMYTGAALTPGGVGAAQRW